MGKADDDSFWEDTQIYINVIVIQQQKINKKGSTIQMIENRVVRNRNRKSW